MSEQLALVPAEPKLTDRQKYALAIVEANGGAPATQIGQALHVRRGKHDGRSGPCTWCEDEGRAVLVELRRKGLVVRRRTGMWQVRDGKPVAPSNSLQTNDIPF